MLKANFITADEAARKVKDGDTVCSIAMTLVSVSESILKALEKRFWKADIPLILPCFILADRVIEKMESSTLHMKAW